MTIKEKLCEPLGKFYIETSKELEEIADDYAIKFALFLSLNCETNGEKDGWWFYRNEWKTTNEILEIFKKEKGL